MNINFIKQTLINFCKTELEKSMVITEKLMAEAQEEANKHKGAMESRYDTFKEEAQALKDGHARQLNEILSSLEILGKIELKKSNTINLGSLIVTNEMNYFVAVNVSSKPTMVESEKYIIISYNSPICEMLKKYEVGDCFIFRNREIEITAIF